MSLRLALSIPFLFVVAGFAATAHAQPATCIPAAQGVPWLLGPPQWWAGSAQFQRAGVVAPDDPRWQGSFQHAFSFGGLPSESRMRMLEDGDWLYFGVWSETQLTSVAIGFVVEVQGVPERLVVLKLVASTYVSGPSSNTLLQLLDYPRRVGQLWQLNAGTSTTAAPWGTNPTVDALIDQVIEWGGATVGANTAARVMHWRVHRPALQAFLGADIDDGRFWAGLVRTGAVGTQVNNYPDVWPPASAMGSTLATLLGSNGLASPTNIALPGSSASPLGFTSSGCVGVSIAPSGIFIEHENPLSQDTTVTIPAASQPPTDDYVAVPNYAGTPTNRVQGVFRLARWGSQSGSSASASWVPLGPVTGVNDRWVPSGALDVRLRDCLATDCPPPSSGQSAHQCMLVELRKTPTVAGAVTFVRDSAFRNLNFVPAGSFERGMGTAAWAYRDQFRLAVPAFNDADALGRVFRYHVRIEPVAIPGLAEGGLERPDQDLAAFLDAPYEDAALQIGPAIIASVQREDLDTGDEVGATQTSFAYTFELPEPGLSWRLSVNGPRGEPLLDRPDQILTIDAIRGGEPLDLELILETSSASDVSTLDPVDDPEDAPTPMCGVGRGSRSSASVASLIALLLGGAWRRKRPAPATTPQT